MLYPKYFSNTRLTITILIVAIVIVSTIEITVSFALTPNVILKEVWRRDLGHLGTISSIAWNPNGKVIAAGTSWRDNNHYYGSIVIFSTSGEQLLVIPYLGGEVVTLSWSPDGKKLAVAVHWKGWIRHHCKIMVFSYNGTLLWEKELTGLFGDIIKSVAWDPQGKEIAIGTSRGRLILLSDSGNILWVKELDKPITSLSWNPHKLKIAVALYDPKNDYSKVVFISRSGKLYETLRLFDGIILSLLWSPDGEKLAIGTSEGKLYLFDYYYYYSGYYFEKIWSKSLDGEVRSIVWGLDGKVVVAAVGKKIVVFSSERGKVVGRSSLFDFTVSALSPNIFGRKFAAGIGSTLIVFRLAEPPYAKFTFSGKRVVGKPITFDATSSFDPDGRIVIYIWDFGDGSIVETKEPIVKHVYTKAGLYNVTLKVIDNDNFTSYARQTIRIWARPCPPIAKFDIKTFWPCVSETVVFDASESYDPDGGHIVKYIWDFGDGNVTVTVEPIVSHVYSKPGKYRVVLTVVDDDMLNSTVTKIVEIHSQSLGEIIWQALTSRVAMGLMLLIAGILLPIPLQLRILLAGVGVVLLVTS